MKFTAVSILLAGLLLAAAVLFEKFLCKDRKAMSATHYITYTAVFSCMSAVLMLIEIPLFFAPSFYKIDLSEIPVLICTFYLGPVSGYTAELLKIVLFLLLHGTTSAFVGEAANFFVGLCLVLTASCVYHFRPGKKSALAGMIAGTLTMTVAGSLFNAKFLIPQFAVLYNIPIDAIISMGTAVNRRITDISTLVLFAVVPFNLVKGLVDCVITFLLYKRISPILHKGDDKRIKRINSAAKE